MRNIINARLTRWHIIKTCLEKLSIHKPILYFSKSSLYLNQTNKQQKKDFGFGHPLEKMWGKHVPVLPLIIYRQPKVLWNMTFWKGCKIHVKCVKALCLSNKPRTHSFSYFSNFLASIEAVLQKERSALNSGICEDSNCHRIDLLWRKVKANQPGERLNTGGCLVRFWATMSHQKSFGVPLHRFSGTVQCWQKTLPKDIATIGVLMMVVESTVWHLSPKDVQKGSGLVNVKATAYYFT